MKNLCIDFGSTFVKFFVCENARIIMEDRLSFPPPSVQTGKTFRVPAEEIRNRLFQILELASPYSPTRCFLSVQMHGYLLKEPNGCFSDYISWRDQTGDTSLPGLAELDYDRRGTARKENLPLVKLWNHSFAPGTAFFTLGSYLAFLLTGRNLTHITDGCPSGFYDRQTLEALDVPENLTLPEVTNRLFTIGKWESMAVYPPVGDHQTSFLGSGAGDGDGMLLNIGTATQLSTLTSEKNPACTGEKRPYFDSRTLLTISGLPGGEKLYHGYCQKDFLKSISDAISVLPKKKRLYLGGGGAGAQYAALSEACSGLGMECILTEENIGKKGLLKMCEQTEQKIGTMLSEVCFPNFPILLRNYGMDFLLIDNEHGAFDYGFLSAVITNARLCNLKVIVRLPDNSRRDITKLCDMGASGFLLPMTNTPEDIKQVVDYAKYTPVGMRGISTNRAHTFYNPPPLKEYMVSANENMKIYAQIETREGLENIRGILAADGVEGVFLGPNDLSCDLNCIGDSKPIFDAMEQISAAAREAGKTWGIITTSSALITHAKKCGADLISYGSEINMLKDSCKKIRGAINEL